MQLPQPPPQLEPLLKKHLGSLERFQEFSRLGADAMSGDRYRHWDKLRHLNPPPDFTHLEWWTAIKLGRLSHRRPLPLEDKIRRPFWYSMPDRLQELLHLVDGEARGQIEMSEPVADPGSRDRYIVHSLMEEAITSSQLEGASTTHKAAKEMLRSGRKPGNRDERMIFNNYEAMRWIRDHRSERLTKDLVLELHRIVTADTLEDPDGAGRLRKPGEEVWVKDEAGQMLHEPPPAGQLAGRMEAMCTFANGEEQRPFLHPVIRAVVLHFWLAYDHPFVDGNGRTARALFYWSMLSQKYWLAEFLSISRIVKKAPSRYARAFLYTETDENDLTYFLLYHLDLVRVGIRELHAYLERKMAEQRAVTQLLRKSAVFNHRQISLLGHAVRHPDTLYTIESHRASHDVVYQTARTDLLELEAKGLLLKRRSGKSFVFRPTPGLEKRLRALK